MKYAQTVISKDGTKIGYRSMGRGPGLILVQGAMGTIDNFTQLAQELSASFTVYLPERRGRGTSPKPFTEDYSIQRDLEDINAILSKTKARYIFGLSSGGIITLQAALMLPKIEKVVVYEPALYVNGLPIKALSRFKNDMAQGKTADALVTAMKAAQMGPPALNYMPNWLLVIITNVLLNRERKRAMDGGDLYMNQVARTLQYDFKVVDEMSDKWQTFKNIKIEVLLLGGSKSPAYLKDALDALEATIPHAKRIEFPRLGHGSPWNYDKQRNPDGQPKVVAKELQKFFVK